MFGHAAKQRDPVVEMHHPALALVRGGVWSATPGRGGLCLRAQGGLVWVTIAGDAQDYLVHAGETLCLRRRTKVVAQALADSVLTVG